MIQYAFDVDIATEYGVPEAIFVHRLYWWVRDNQANNRNLKDGKYWTYDSLTALTQIFGFWSRRQIEGVINRCREKGLILTASYNDNPLNRTTWYTVTDKVVAYYGDMQITEQGNAYHQTGKCTSPDGDAHITKRGNVYKEQLEDQLEDKRECARAEQEKTKKQTYGEFGNVQLADTELDKLCSRWTRDQVQNEIEALSAYMRSKGKTYKDHYAALTVWLKRDYTGGQSAPKNTPMISTTRKETREL